MEYHKSGKCTAFGRAWTRATMSLLRPTTSLFSTLVHHPPNRRPMASQCSPSWTYVLPVMFMCTTYYLRVLIPTLGNFNQTYSTSTTSDANAVVLTSGSVGASQVCLPSTTHLSSHTHPPATGYVSSEDGPDTSVLTVFVGFSTH